MPLKKKKVVFHSDYPASNTGFARNLKSLLTYLWKTGKYDLINYVPSMLWGSDEYKRFPWKTFGAIPNNSHEQMAIQNNQDEAYKRRVYYGEYSIDRLIKEEKPDVYVGVNDFWGVDFCINRKWWNKINSILHVTLDSTPLLPSAVDMSKNIKHYYVWADFAAEILNKLGHEHVKTVYGAIDEKNFFNLGETKKKELRDRFNIPQDAFVIGYVFRNQLRKEVHVLLDAFKDFLRDNPDAKTYLLLHTHWSEPSGWDIPRLLEEKGVPKEKVLTTYVCKNCREIEVKPFDGQDKDCRFCGSEKSQITCNVQLGATEEQLNVVYNLMDCYTQIFNAGGLEIPIVEALYTELPVGVTNYACGETFCREKFIHPFKHHLTKQIGTQFDRASTYPSSVTRFLNKIYHMSKEKRASIGAIGRKWALDNFSVSVIGKKWEEILDALPEVEWDFNFVEQEKRPEASIDFSITDNAEFLKHAYREILLMEEGNDSSGLKYWLEVLKKGGTREQIVDFMRQTAMEENNKNKEIGIEDLFDEETKGKRILFVVKESGGDIYYIKSLLESAKELYPDYYLYFATEPKFQEIVESDPHVYRVINYQQIFENEMEMRKHVEVLYIPAIFTQRQLHYLTRDKYNVELK